MKKERVGKGNWQISHCRSPYKHFTDLKTPTDQAPKACVMLGGYQVDWGIFSKEWKIQVHQHEKRRGRRAQRGSAFPGSMPLIIQLYLIYICILPILVLMDQINMPSTSWSFFLNTLLVCPLLTYLLLLLPVIFSYTIFSQCGISGTLRDRVFKNLGISMQNNMGNAGS